jgi:shikimate kinase
MPMGDARDADDAPIFLIGFMASGKTTVGRLVARRLGWGFEDLDDLIVAAAGASVPQIFAEQGELGFRRRETEAVVAAAARRATVFATGGGAACREPNLSTMLGAGRVVALDVSAPEAVRRAGDSSGRPLLDGQADKLAAARTLLASREAYYRRAHVRVATDGRTPEEVAGAVLEQLALGGDA